MSSQVDVTPEEDALHLADGYVQQQQWHQQQQQQQQQHLQMKSQKILKGASPPKGQGSMKLGQYI